MKPDTYVHGIRLTWDPDSEVYFAQMTEDDINDLWDEAYDEGWSDSRTSRDVEMT